MLFALLSLLLISSIDTADAQILILKLTIPVSELVPFCPESSEHYAKIIVSERCILLFELN